MTGGVRIERRLARFLTAANYAVMRSPASGGGVSRNQPDILGVLPTRGIAVEIKTVRAGDTAYLSWDELDALVEFSERAGVRPTVIVRWKRDRTFYVYDARDIPTVRGSETKANRKITPDDRKHAEGRLADFDDVDEWNDEKKLESRLSPGDVAENGVYAGGEMI